MVMKNATLEGIKTVYQPIENILRFMYRKRNRVV